MLLFTCIIYLCIQVSGGYLLRCHYLPVLFTCIYRWVGIFAEILVFTCIIYLCIQVGGIFAEMLLFTCVYRWVGTFTEILLFTCIIIDLCIQVGGDIC